MIRQPPPRHPWSAHALLVLVLSALLPSVPAATLTDNCIDANNVFSNYFTNISLSNAAATMQASETAVPTGTGNHSLWATFTAPATCMVSVSSKGSSIDTVVGVYTGAAVNALTLVAYNDEYTYGDVRTGGRTSLAVFNATAGTSYRIRIDGYLTTNVGTCVLSVQRTPTLTVALGTSTLTESPTPPSTTCTFTLSSSCVDQLPMAFSLSGTATAGVDYSLTSSPMLMPANSTTAATPLALMDDANFEASETAIITLAANTSPAGSQSGTVTSILGSPSTATLTIINDDPIYVDAAATGSNTGQSWSNAFTDLQSALAAATAGNQIWVKAGTYKPTVTTTRSISFVLPANVQIYGGFAGGETQLSQRDWGANQTLLSGEINVAGYADNTNHVVVGASGAVLDGVIISDGYAQSGYGGALTCNGISMTVRNCIFTANRGWYGGALLIDSGGDPLIENCLFTGNTSEAGGGAILVQGGGKGIFRNCTVAGNTAGNNGGGIWVNLSIPGPVLINTVVWGNTAAASKSIHLYSSSATSGASWSFSDIEGCGGSGAWSSTFGTNNGGNLDSNPAFINAGSPSGADGKWGTPDDGYIPGATSLTIDNGTATGAPSTDLRRAPRGFGGIDMGAYERRALIYVNTNAAGTNDGSSWTNAYNELRDALAPATSAIAPGATVWVAAGSYLPTVVTDRSASFATLSGVALYGGFAGNEGSLAQRSVSGNICTLSGNIGSDVIATDNSYHVVRLADASTLDGFVVTGGYASGVSPDNRGGGIYASGAAVTIANCSVRANYAGNWGGGLMIDGGTLNLSASSFLDNNAGFGAGIFANLSGGAVDACVFKNNIATTNGGGMFLEQTGGMPVRNCLFTGNQAGSATYGGGGLLAESTSGLIINSTFQGNSAPNGKGGGVLILSGTSVILRNDILWGNTAVTDAQACLSGGSASIAYSDLQTGSLPTGFTGSNNLFNQDPQFISTADPDGADNRWGTADDGLIPSAGSPVIDAGVGTGAPATDCRGLARPSGQGYDMGCYERQVRFVNPTASGSSTGASWANAHTSLATALAAANAGDEIWVVAGTYTPTVAADPTASFVVKANVAVYGGFTGTETARGQRDWIANQVVLSGDIGTVGDSSDNSYLVATLASDAVLDGVTVRDGNNNTTWPRAGSGYGSGIITGGSSNWVLRNCVITGNACSYYGAGLHAQGGTGALVTRCVFSGNTGQLYGGGVYITSTGAISNTVFSGNQANSAANHGGGAILSGSSALGVVNCTFLNNRAGYMGGAIVAYTGTTAVTNSIFWGSSATSNVDLASTGGTVTASYCDLRAGFAGTGNFDADPYFINASNPAGSDGRWMDSDDGLRLRADSPCVDPASVGGAPALDIIGLVRPLGSAADLGAYEGRVPVVGFAASSSTWNENAGTVSIPVTLSQASDLTVTVAYAAMGGTATLASDYTIAAGPLVFAPGQTSKNIQLTIIDDAIGEDEERIHLALTSISNGTSNGGDVHTAHIAANDLPVISMPASVSGDEGTSVSVPVTMTGTHQSTVTVRYRLVDDSAIVGTDVTAVTGTLTWAPGTSGTRTFNVPITADLIAEGAERVGIALSVEEAVAVNLSTPTAWLNINDLNTAGIVITDVNGGPHVAEATSGVGDTYQVRLRSQPEDTLLQLGNVGTSTAGSSISSVVASGGIAFYVCNDGVHGSELWTSDGSVGGTRLVKDINAGSASSNPANLTAFHGYVVFTADDGSHGTELWRSDGSAGGTVMLKDIYPGANSSFPTAITAVDRGLVFAANDGTNGTELWFTDLSTTSLVMDIYAGSGSSQPNSFAVVYGRAYFAATHATSGRELWTSDGTPGGTRLVKDCLSGSGSSSPRRLTAVGSRLFFTAYDATNGRELWVSDGTSTGTSFVKNINPATNDDDPAYDPTAYVYPYPHYGAMAELNGKLVFLVEDGVHGKEPWVSDGTSGGTFLLKDIASGSGDSVFWYYPGFYANTTMARAGGRILFPANDGSTGVEMWSTDGTSVGTTLLKDIQVGSGGSAPTNLTRVTVAGVDRVLFQAITDAAGAELWMSDGTTGGTALLKDCQPGAGYSNPSFIAADADSGFPAYFQAYDTTNGGELFTTDGTTAGTHLAGDANAIRQDQVASSAFKTSWNDILFSGYDGSTPVLMVSNGTYAGTHALGSVSFSNPVEMGGKVYFDGYDSYGHELWVYNPASGGSIQRLSSFSPGDDADPSAKVVYNGKLYFTATDQTIGGLLAAYDGTSISIIASSSTPLCIAGGGLTAWNGKLYFSAADVAGSYGYELWESDGTTGGTHRISDISVGSGGSFPQGMVALAGTLCFQAYDGTSYCLYAYNGTTVAKLHATATYFSSFTVVGSRIYFSAYTPAAGYEPWVSDGTVGGTALLLDLQSGAGSSSPSGFTQVGSRVFFAADDGSHGSELWSTDGTAGGTALVADIVSGSTASYPQYLTEVAGLLYFTADDGIHGQELWASDGTSSGTRQVRDFLPGTSGSNPQYLSRLGSGSSAQLFLSARTDSTGQEPWLLTPAQLTITCTRSNTPYFQVTLDSDPVTAGNQNTLAFTSLNWNVNRTVTVWAIDDLIDEDDPHTTTIAHAASSTDAHLGGAASLPAETVYIQDNDSAAVTVSTISGHTTEAGGTATFTVVLASQPTANVRVSFASNRATEGVVTNPGVGYVDFTPANWNSARTITVTGQDDAIADGNQAYAINVSAAVSTDGKYNGIGATSVNVINDDNDTAGFTLVGVSIPSLTSPLALTVQSVTAATSTVAFSPGSDLSTLRPGMLMTIAGGSNGGKSGYLASVDDANDRVTLSALSSALADAASGGTATIGAFSTLATRETALVLASTGTTAATGRVQFAGGTDLSRVRIGMSVVFSGGGLNNNTRGYVTAINPAAATIDVGSPSTALVTTGVETVTIGGYVNFLIRLTSQPTGQVTIPISSSDTTEGTVSTGSVSLDAGTWNTGVQVTVSTVDDLFVDGDIAFSVVTGTTTSTDGNYNAKNPLDVSVVNLDDDVAGLLIVQSGGTTAVTEGGATDTYTVQLASLPSADVTVTVTRDDPTYGVTVNTGSGNTITFTTANWNSPRTVTVTAVDDTRYEGAHADTLRHTAASTDANYVLADLPANRISVAITDNDTQPVLTVGDLSVNENVGGGNAVVTVTPSNASAAGFSLTFRTVAEVAAGKATAGTDYTAQGATVLSWAANDASAKNITIPITNDALDEDNETFLLRLDTATGCSIASAVGGVRDVTVTIIDDDAPPTVAFTSASQAGNESDGTLAKTVTVHLSAVSGRSVSVPFTTGGTATPTSDYTVSASPLVFAPGVQDQTVTITIVNDALNEAAETAVVTLGTPTNATLGATTSHTLTISDNDALPVVVVHAANSTSAENAGTVNIQVDLGPVSGRAVSVPFSITAGNAIAGSDFNILTASPLIISPGSTTANIQVQILDDALFEDNETVEITLGTPTNATLGATTIHTLTITDNDTAPTVGFAAATQADRAESFGITTATVQLSAVSGKAVTVNVGASGSATAGTDYTLSPSGSITIPAGSLSGSITINIVDDDLDEVSESVTLTLSVPGNATLAATTTHTFNILDNDNPPTLAIANTSSAEGNADHPATVTVTMTGRSATAVTVNYATSNGTATQPADYTTASGTLTWNAGETGAKTFPVTIIGDGASEQNETVNLTLSGPAGATLATPTAVLTILDDDGAQVVLSAVSGSVTEGLTKTYNIHLASGSAPTSEVHVTVVPGAGCTVDHPDLYFDATATGTPTGFTSGNALAYGTDITITVTATNDALYQGSRTVVVTNTTASVDGNYNNRVALYSLDITDDESAPTLSIAANTPVGEGAGTVDVVVTPSVASATEMRVNWSTVELAAGLTHALAGADYTSANGTLVWAAADAAPKNITVTIPQDVLVERAETFEVLLAGAVGCTIAAGTGTVSITDDDTATLGIDSPSVAEGNSGTTNLDFTVTMSKASVDPVTVDYATSNGTATVAGGDYTATSGTLTIPAGSTSGTITVPVTGDTYYEAAETLTVTLSAPSGATITTATGTGTITNDDAAPTLAISDLTVTEDVGTALVTVTMSGQREGNVTVDWATVGGTAVAGSDFTTASGTLTWTAGMTGAQTVSVPIIDDLLNEGGETFTVVLSAETQATIAVGTGTVTITDNDPLPTVSFAVGSQSGSEGDGVLAKTVTVQLSAASGRTVTVPFAATGTATLGSDFTLSASPLVFAAGETSKTVTITIIDDSLVETAETVIVTLGPPAGALVNAAAGAPLDHTLTINDNDVANILVQPATALTTTEAGGTAMFAVRLSAAPATDVDVDLNATLGIGEGSLIGETASHLHLTFTPTDWNLWQLVTVQGLADSVADGDRIWTITSSATGGFTIPTGPAIPVRNLNLDSAGVVIATGGGVAVDEAGGSDTYTITLATKPPSGTTVAITANADSQVLIDGGTSRTIWFGPSHLGAGASAGTCLAWSESATITVTAVADDFAETAVHPGVITHSATGGGYDAVSVAAVTVSVTDHNTAGFVVGALVGGNPQEGLGGGCLIANTVANASIVSGTITFAAGPAGAFVGQTLRIGSGGAGANAGQEFTIDAVAGSTVHVTGISDDAGVIPVTFYAAVPVTVTSRPTAQIILPVSCSDATQATVAPASLVFSADGSWSTIRYVTVRAVDDVVDDGDQQVRVLFGASVSADPHYNNTGPVPAQSALITLVDDDAAGLLITYDGPVAEAATLRVTEAGDIATCRIHLTAKPLLNVTIPLSPSVAGQGSVLPATLLFTPSNWNVDQVVTVTGGDGDLADNPVAGTLWSVVTGAPSGSAGGDGYQGLTGGEAGFPDIAVRTMPSNGSPSFTAIADQTFPEDSGSRTVTVTGISAGPGETQVLTLRATSSNPSLIPDPLPVAVTVAGASRVLDITPQADQNGSAVITVTLTDDATIGSDPARSTIRTFTVTVVPVNDPPVVDLNGPAAGIDAALVTYAEGATPVALAVADVEVTDADSATMVAATVRLQSGGGGLPPDGILESLTVDTGITGILATWDAAAATLTLSGNVTRAAYQQVLRTLRYADASDAPDTSTRTVEVRVDDGSGIQATGSVTVVGGVVTGIAVTNGGAGYGETPVITINGAGTGAAATATVVGGVITAITVAPGGTGYASPGTTVTISAPRSVPAHAYVTVQPTNDAPLLSGAGTLTPIAEGLAPGANGGDTIASLIGAGKLVISDPDGAGSLQGVAVIDADATHGSWEYSLDGGAAWSPLGIPTALQARLLSPNSLVRFLPAAYFNGSAAITVRAWDQTDGSIGGQRPADTGFIGGTTAFSLASVDCTITVTAVVDAPVVDLNGPAASLDYTAAVFVEDGPPVAAVDPAALTIIAPDTGSLVQATVVLSGGTPLDGVAETLAVDTAGTAIVATYTAATGTLQLLPPGGTPSLPVADWQQVLRTLTYANASQAPQGGPRSITVQVNDGSNANAPLAVATVPVTPVNDAPVIDGTGQLTGIAEGVADGANAGDTVASLTAAVATAGKVVFTDADQAGVQGFVVVAANNANGTWQYDAGAGWLAIGSPNVANALLLDAAAKLRFVPAPFFNGTADLTVCAWDGSNGLLSGGTGNASINGGVSAYGAQTTQLLITVSPVNDAPVVDLNGAAAGSDATATYGENSGPLLFAIPATVLDVDSPLLQSMAVTLVEHPEGVEETLVVDVTGTAITAAAYDATTGQLVLSGPDTPAAFQQVLRTLSYQHSGLNPTGGVRHITVVANDGSLPSSVVTAALTVVPVNDAPRITVNNGLSLAFGTSPAITTTVLTAVDVDSPAVDLIFHLTLAPNKGQLQRGGVTLTNGDVFHLSDLDPAAPNLRYVHGGVLAGADGLAFTVSDGVASSATQVFNLTIIGQARPTLALAVANRTYTEDDPPLQLDANAVVDDSDSPDFSGGWLRVDYAANPNQPGDTLSVGNIFAGQVVVDASTVPATVSYAGHVVGTVSGGNDGTPLVVTFTTAFATKTAATTILRSIQFSSPNQNPSAVSRILSITVNDGGLTCLTPGTITLAVVPVDDPPAAAGVTRATVVDLPIAVPVLAADPEGTALTYQLCNQTGDVAPFANGGAQLATVEAGAAISGGFSFTYRPAVGISSQDDTFHVLVTDQAGAGLTRVVTVTIHITGPEEAAPAFLSNPPLREAENSTLIYLPQLRGGVPAQARWTLINPPAGLDAGSMGSGNLNWTTPVVSPALFQYVPFGILIEDTATNRAGYQPVLLKVAGSPAGNG